MAQIEQSIEISRPPADVFAVVNDVSRWSEWQEDVLSAHIEGEGPIREGTRIAQSRKLGKRVLTTTTEVTEYDPPRSYGFRGIGGPIRPIARGTVEPLDGDRSRVTLKLDFEGHGPGKVVLPLVRRQARKTLTRQQQRLKEILESGSA
ncbi:MAG TPA: SRPBCC family protein [Gaiellaceae bacterium]|nr:SRPBCC family protein [Gaiellaceae bacterium]